MFNRWLIVASPIALIVGMLTYQVSDSPATAQMGPMTQQPLEQRSGDSFDTAFLSEMTMHHAMGVMMTRPLLANAAHPEAQQLARTIIDDQTREIALMRGWARDWYGVTMPDPMGMMDGMMGPMGPMSHSGHGGMMPSSSEMSMGMMGGMSMMADLWKLPAPRLEAVFLSQMIPHHEGAITMAKLAPERAAHQEIKDLAQSIIQSQSSEIDTMNAWLAAWYGL